MSPAPHDELMSDPLIQQFIAWAEARHDVRAVILTSTRTIPGAKLDIFSDYDVILVVENVQRYFNDRSWLEDFGPVLVLYRDPIRQAEAGGRFAYITQYELDRLKIDFTVMHVDVLGQIVSAPQLPDDFDVGYCVLLDKDELTDGLPPPAYQAFLPMVPTRAEYLEHIEVFFHEATYVAKNIWRDELLPARYSLEYMMKLEFVREMLNWRMGITHNWQIKTGSLGKGLKRHTPPHLWSALEATYTGAGEAASWDSLFRTIDFYRVVAHEVGDALGYTYPEDMDQRVVTYLQKVRYTQPEK